MEKQPARILTTVAPDRREFVKRILAVTAFAAPAVLSFSIADRAMAAGTTAKHTTSAPCQAIVGPLGCWPGE